MLAGSVMLLLLHVDGHCYGMAFIRHLIIFNFIRKLVDQKDTEPGGRIQFVNNPIGIRIWWKLLDTLTLVDYRNVDGTLAAIHINDNPGVRTAIISMLHGIDGCLGNDGLQILDAFR